MKKLQQIAKLCQQGRWQTARKILLQTQAELAPIAANCPDTYAYVVLKLAHICEHLKLYADALKYFQEALTWYRYRFSSPDFYAASCCLQGMGLMEIALGRFDKALFCLEEAKKGFLFLERVEEIEEVNCQINLVQSQLPPY